VLRELAEELAKPLFIIYQQSWLTGEVPDDWRITSVTPIYKESWKDDSRNYKPVCLTSSRNYKPVCLTSVPRKIME